MTPRRLVVAAALTGLLAPGCNMIARAQGGPAVVAANDTPYGGAEGSADLFVDMAAGAEALNGQEPPETARRIGVVGGAHVRGTGLGFGVGARSGAFVGATNADTLIIGSVQASGGMQTYEGDAYGAVGGVGALAFGVRVGKSYDTRAVILCRSLTYLTFTAQGLVDYLPSAGITVPGAALLLGVAGLDDAGAPSDRARPEARCPR